MAWRTRMRAHADAAFVHLLVNERREGGASLPHTHAQLYALPFVPAAVARERERFTAYATRTMGGNLLADLLQEEVRMRDRDRRDRRRRRAARALRLAAAVPAHARPAPRARPLRGRRADRRRAAARRAAAPAPPPRRLAAAEPVDPHGAARAPTTFCWRIDILPRLTHLAGLELGAGTHLCVVAPEVAAQELRDV